MKFERMMKQFCREIGIDKKTLLTMFMGGANTNSKQNIDIEGSNTKNNENSSSKQQYNSRDSVTNLNLSTGQTIINTGAAAQMAYNNMIPSSKDPESIPMVVTQNQFMKLRANGLKTRNSNNYSLTENSMNSNGHQSQQQQTSFVGDHSRQGNILKNNYDTESGLFSDFRAGGGSENHSFNNDLIVDKKKLSYQQQQQQ